MAERQRVRISGLWARQLPNGEKVLSGTFGTAQLSIYKNGFKNGEKDPDFIAYIEHSEKAEGGAQGRSTRTREQSSGDPF